MSDVLSIQYVEDGQKKAMPITDAVLTIFSRGRQLQAMPDNFDIALRIGAANGLKEAVFVTADVFFASIIAMVAEARADLVTQAQATDTALQAQLSALNAVPVLKAIGTNVTATFTATVALLAGTTKTVAVSVPGVLKDELLVVQPKSLPVGWGYQGAVASANDTVTFSLAVPPLSINGTGTCIFAVFAQRKLVP